MWDRLKYKFSNFMNGRNGPDDINRVLIFVILAVEIAAIFTKLPWLNTLGWVLLIIYTFRFFSRNIEARYRECTWVRNVFKLWKLRLTQGREYSYFMCRSCLQVIRVPKHRGRLEVRCSKCGAVKIINTGRS